MRPGNLLRCTLITPLLVVLLSSGTTLGATGLSLSVALLGEPDIFVPGLELSAEISITRSLGLFAGGAYLISGTWDLVTGLRWHLSPRFALQLQALLLFDVIDGFVPQLGMGVRWGFPLARSLSFFNELGLSVPLKERFVQPVYGAGVSLEF